MTGPRTHYDVLGVPSSATTTEIRRAYHRLAQELHPDRRRERGRPGGARAMQDLNEAWRVLRDPDRRRGYDAALLAALPTARVARAATSSAAWRAGLDPDDPRLDPDVDLDPRPYYHPAPDAGDVGAQVLRLLPWAVLATVMAIVFVFTAYAGSGARDRPEPVMVGSCVSIQPALGVVSTSCDGPHDGRVVSVAGSPSRCPSGTIGHTTRNGGRTLCLRKP